MKKNYRTFILCLLGSLIFTSCTQPPAAEKPNVIVVITDDQGYGDLSVHGNPWLKTPNLDKLHAESVRFTDFHVATTCAPTRSGLMTGKYCNKVGAWHTIMGRHIVWEDEKMLPELFQQAGYTTGMFGKWHLGDNYPYRPQDRGFDEVLMHGGGGVGQTPDFWNNDYFDDTYFRNGTPEKTEGYCTDVWFQGAIDFIEDHADRPFFCYLATNAPHGPFRVDTSYVAPYKGIEEIPNAPFLGMIANIDENMGRLREKLVELNIADNTILVFLTDNGTAAGVSLDKQGFLKKGYNSGMRGKKGSPFEGGHRVPLFIHWKNGEIQTGKDIDNLAAYVDLAPTLLNLCGIEMTSAPAFDGTSLAPLMKGEKWEDRVLFADTQREEQLKKYKQYAVLTEEWRMVNGELFDINKDPGQTTDLAEANPEVVAELKAAYETWWEDVSYRADDIAYIPLGGDVKMEQVITAHDLHNQNTGVAWNQGYIRNGYPNQGYYAVEIKEKGTYQFELRRWPKESGLAYGEIAPEGDLTPQGKAYKVGKDQNITAAAVRIAGQEKEFAANADTEGLMAEFELEPGKYELNTFFKNADGEEWSAYYVYAKLMRD